MVLRGKESVWYLGASLSSVSAFSAVTALLSPAAPTALAVRHASKKTGGSSKNLGGKSRGKHYGIKKMEGEGVPCFRFPAVSCSAALPFLRRSRMPLRCLTVPVSWKFTVALVPTLQGWVRWRVESVCWVGVRPSWRAIREQTWGLVGTSGCQDFSELAHCGLLF